MGLARVVVARGAPSVLSRFSPAVLFAVLGYLLMVAPTSLGVPAPFAPVGLLVALAGLAFGLRLLLTCPPVWHPPVAGR